VEIKAPARVFLHLTKFIFYRNTSRKFPYIFCGRKFCQQILGDGLFFAKNKYNGFVCAPQYLAFDI
jgi:hypothetical protein